MNMQEEDSTQNITKDSPTSLSMNQTTFYHVYDTKIDLNQFIERVFCLERGLFLNFVIPAKLLKDVILKLKLTSKPLAFYLLNNISFILYERKSLSEYSSIDSLSHSKDYFEVTLEKEIKSSNYPANILYMYLEANIFLICLKLQQLFGFKNEKFNTIMLNLNQTKSKSSFLENIEFNMMDNMEKEIENVFIIYEMHEFINPLIRHLLGLSLVLFSKENNHQLHDQKSIF